MLDANPKCHILINGTSIILSLECDNIPMENDIYYQDTILCHINLVTKYICFSKTKNYIYENPQNEQSISKISSFISLNSIFKYGDKDNALKEE